MRSKELDALDRILQEESEHHPLRDEHGNIIAAPPGVNLTEEEFNKLHKDLDDLMQQLLK